ncbi:MAG TPA: beta-glucosidase BglX [Verrucomicrobiae bacterium]|jgi:beta-glucosidase|nr:beta-glucosidase BglX [Verrucomicrobiae bacterium]
MKTKVFMIGCWLAALGVWAADTNSIYHPGWIDLNKDGKRNVYEDASQPVEKRVNDLLRRMSLDEKIGQLWQIDWARSLDPQVVARLRHGEVGSFLGSDATVESPIMRNKLQHVAVEESRLGIPAIFGHDVIHGFRTVFPIPLGMACAWEPELFERTEAVAARESSAAGIDWTFAPMADLARDPRWGRIAESFGEDPWLGCRYSVACVRGFQGTNVADTDRVLACMKHYVGYGAAEGGRDYNTTEISDFTLWNFYLPQFKAGLDAGALTVMSAFNCLSGFPASANRHALTDILRGDFKFRGFVVSDYESVGQLEDHGVAADDAAAARLALTAGVDMEMISKTYHDTLKQQVEQGTVPPSVVDEAVRRVLRVKFEKGLFDRPYADESRYQTAYLHDDALELSREAGAKSCVLLKNTNNVLPLSLHFGKIALIGPLAENAQEMVGPWHSRAHTNELVSLADAMRKEVDPGVQISVARGCALFEPGVIKVPRDITNFLPLEGSPTRSNEIPDAVALAKKSDVVVMALGEPLDWSGEDGSRSELGLPGLQQQLFDAVVATGKPVVVVLFNGRPLAISELQKKATAILEAWFPGTHGAEGVADILFGKTDPAGRLTTTFPRNVGQVPFYYNHYNTGRPGFGEYKGNYVDIETTPLYPFGFGLAYTTFDFGNVGTNIGTVPLNGKLTVQAEIKNTGARAGTAVAELYIRALAASAGPRPVRELKGFQKILLQPGESREVSFDLSTQELGYYDASGHWLVEPGKYQVWIAKDSAAGDPAGFEITR